LILSLFLVFNFSVYPAQAVFDENDIIFEYGAESGGLQPPWDLVQEQNGADVSIETSIVHSGTKSIKFETLTGYSGQPRGQLNLWHDKNNDDLHESTLYLSMWVYLPDAYDLQDWDSMFDFHWKQESWANMRRIRTYFSRDGSNIIPATIAPDGNWKENATTVFPKNQWFHVQQYLVIDDTNGVMKLWVDNDLVFDYSNFNSAYTPDGNAPDITVAEIKIYCDSDEPRPLVKYVDDYVLATEKVPEDYTLGGSSLEFESWETSWEEGDFSDFNGTQQGGGGVAPSVTSTYAYTGTYSANFTTNGADSSYSRAMHIIQNTTEVYQRSYVRFEDLPDANDTRLLVLRIAQEEGTWITSAGVNMTGGNYFWYISETDGTANYTQDAINADQWYLMEYHFNTTIGELWINNTLMCQMSGDFSDSGNLARVYPYLYVEGAQASAKTVYHDNYRVDDVRIGGGTPVVVQTVEEEEDEDDPDTYSEALPSVTINGSYLTNTNGLYEFTNLTYNEIYVFIAELPNGYYPRWVENVDGGFEWNGTHFVITHNVTEGHEGYLKFVFTLDPNAPHIPEATGYLTTVSVFYSSTTRRMYLTMTGATTALIDTHERFTPRYYDVSGATDWFWIGLVYTFEVEGTSAVTVEWR